MNAEMEMAHEPNSEVAALRHFRVAVNLACHQIKRSRYEQEPNYVAALMGKLAGLDVQVGTTRLQTTMVNDRGPGAAEKEFGADFAITFEKYSSGISKAVLGQAKAGAIEKLSSVELKKFHIQRDKMSKHTRHFIGFEAPANDNVAPKVRVFVPGPPVTMKEGIDLADYLIDKLIACNHGDKRQSFVNAVQHSHLVQLRIILAGSP